MIVLTLLIALLMTFRDIEKRKQKFLEKQYASAPANIEQKLSGASSR